MNKKICNNCKSVINKGDWHATLEQHKIINGEKSTVKIPFLEHYYCNRCLDELKKLQTEEEYKEL